ncbi:MAG: hypothetical protein JO144_12500 [Actinobacteria bacterium]|nr:hypothetical protein [Actinomycetota bacterium]
MALAVLVSVLVVLANLAVAGLLVLRWDRRFEPPNAPGTRQPAEVRPGR